MKNSKKQYPLPGPADHFMDDHGIKKFRKENVELFK